MARCARSCRSMKAIVMTAVLLTGAGAASAQILAEGQAPGQEATGDRSPVGYVEPGVLFTAESDFTLPPPVLSRNPQLDPEFEQRAADIARLTESISNDEVIDGAWDGRMVEQLGRLGNLHHQQGDHDAAIVTLAQALHIRRIETGLYTLDQIPLLEGMIDSYIAMGDWAQADAYQQYLFYIQQKTHGRESPQLIPALGRLADWHIRLSEIEKGGRLDVQLNAAQALYDSGASIVDEHLGKEDPRYVEYLKGATLSAFLARVYRSELRELNSRHTNGPTEESHTAMFYSKFRSLNRRAEEALSGVVRQYQNQEDATEQLADATAQLADWYLISGNRAKAWETYRRAWNIPGTGPGADEIRRRLFGQVQQLPVYAPDNREWIIESLVHEKEEGEELNYDFVDIKLDITAWGSVRNVETITEALPETESQHRQIRRKIRASRFRPVLVEGEATLSQDNLFRFRYWY